MDSSHTSADNNSNADANSESKKSSTVKSREKLVTSHTNDNIERVDGKLISPSEFSDRFESPRVPCILTGLTDNWPGKELWTLEYIDKLYGDRLEELRSQGPAHVSDPHFGYKTRTKELVDHYSIPTLFKDDLFDYLEKRPCYRSFEVGDQYGGEGISKDDIERHSWSALMKGSKRWVLLPPDTPEDLVSTVELTNSKSSTLDSVAMTWFTEIYPVLLEKKDIKIKEAIQRPGEIIFIPEDWWFISLNMERSVGVTHMYCSLSNIYEVWGNYTYRYYNSMDWLKRLKSARPDCIPIIRRAIHDLRKVEEERIK